MEKIPKPWGKTKDGTYYCFCNRHTLKSKCPVFYRQVAWGFIRRLRAKFGIK